MTQVMGIVLPVFEAIENLPNDPTSRPMWPTNKRPISSAVIQFLNLKAAYKNSKMLHICVVRAEQSF